MMRPSSGSATTIYYRRRAERRTTRWPHSQPTRAVALAVSRLDARQVDVLVGLDAKGASIATLRLGAGHARRGPRTNPADCARHRHTEPLGGGSPRHAGFDRHDQPDPQVFGQGLRHACWPPAPARMVNRMSAASGKPPILSDRIVL